MQTYLLLLLRGNHTLMPGVLVAAAICSTDGNSHKVLPAAIIAGSLTKTYTCRCCGCQMLFGVAAHIGTSKAMVLEQGRC
jgi:hypothetical protein